ncbi:MAG: glycosyltransferase [Chlorobiaceae bacterium]|nr:glycosyltransferase [Chlorobiaceae bacterium]
MDFVVHAAFSVDFRLKPQSSYLVLHNPVLTEVADSIIPSKSKFTHTVSRSLRISHENSKFSVSAFIAVYNPKLDMLRRAVLSVLDQTMPVLELVLVNDGGSEEFRKHLPDDDRIQVFTKPNEGVAATRNFAITQCRGEYIAFLDQDDYWYPDKLKEQTDMIPAPGDICMVVSPADIVDSNGKAIRKKSRTRVARAYFQKIASPDFLLALAEGNFIYSSTPLVHRLVFDRAGLFDPFTQPHDDWDMYLRITFVGVPVYCYRDRALSVWCMHDSNESSKVQAMLLSKCRVEKKLLKVTNDRRLQAVLNTNLLVDYLGRDSIVFKNRRYSTYRALLRRHLVALFRDRGNYRGEMAVLYRDFAKRVRRAVLKATRRYAVSYFLPEKRIAK